MSPIGSNPIPDIPENNNPKNNQQNQPPIQPDSELNPSFDIPLSNSPDAFEQISQEAEVREVQLPKDSQVLVNDKPATISEAIEAGTDLTDMQFIAMKMFPEDKHDSTANISMVARIDPEVFLSLLHINVQNEIMTSDPFRPINVDNIVAKHYYRQSIGLEGRGRIDLAELGGAAKEARERSLLSSGLGGLNAS